MGKQQHSRPERIADTGEGIAESVTQEELRAINEQLLLAGLHEQEQAAEARRLTDVLAHRALHDDLTALPNRALFHDRLRQLLLTARRDGTAFALLFLDLDGFKAINDRLGHRAGDLLLQQVAGRLRGTLRASDTAARLGGDEFAVLLPEVAGMPEALLAGQRLLDSLQPPCMIDGLPQRIGASIGVALYPDHGADIDTLLRRADAAMYLAKETHSTVAVAGIAPAHHTPALAERVMPQAQRRGHPTTPTDATPPAQADPVAAAALNERLLLAGLREQELADQLRHQLAFTAAITGNLGEGVCAFDLALRITFANPAAERLLGWPVAELLGRKFHELLPGGRDASGTRPNPLDALEAVLRVGTIRRDDDTACVRRDGTVVPVAYSAAPIVAAGVTVGLVLTLHDITARKQVEAERERINAKLERRVAERTAELNTANTRLRLIFERLPAIVWTTDTALRFTFVAGAALAALGLAPAQLHGLQLHEIMALLSDADAAPPEQGTTPFPGHRRALAGHPASFMLTVREQNVQVYVEPLRDVDERIIGVIGVAQDITELSVRRLHDDFIAAVSHQLLTPLASARAGLGLLTDSVSDHLGSDDRDLVSNIGRNIGRLGIQLNDLLTLNQRKAGTPPAAPAPLDLRAIVAEARAVVQPLLRAKDQMLTVALPHALPVMGDSDELTQAVINLLFNAHRHTPRGTHIAIGGWAAGTESTLTIRDTGPGIPLAARERIFGRFQRLERPDMVVSGSGLGLAIVREIAERHGGRVWEAGEPGAGAVFQLALPRGGDVVHGETSS